MRDLTLDEMLALSRTVKQYRRSVIPFGVEYETSIRTHGEPDIDLHIYQMSLPNMYRFFRICAVSEQKFLGNETKDYDPLITSKLEMRFREIDENYPLAKPKRNHRYMLSLARRLLKGE